MIIEVKKQQTALPPQPPLEPNPKPEKPKFNYGINTRDVAGRLHAWGLGEPVTFLTENGFNHDQYIPYAQKRLGIDPSQPLPEKIGEVDIPETVKQKAKNIVVLLMSLNAGYGHLRPAEVFGNMVRVLGGDAVSVFFGGVHNVISKRLTPKSLRLDEIFRATKEDYTASSLDKAIQQDMVDPSIIPAFERKTPQIARLLARGTVLLRDPKKLWENTKQQGWGQAKQVALQEAYSAKDVDTIESLEKQNSTLGRFFAGFVRRIAYREFVKNPTKTLLILGTHPTVARTVGAAQAKLGSETALEFLGAHYAPDVQQPLISWVNTQPNAVAERQAAEKWAIRMGISEGQIPENTIVMGGDIAALPIFLQHELAEKRQLASKNGAPLTIVATASGIAPVQLGSFRQFIEAAQGEIRAGKVRMVIQCGAEEGFGQAVYEQLQPFVEQLGIQDTIALHVAKTPEAAVDFVEALEWSEQPIAFLVKAAEVARQAYALGIPVIGTGIVGDHELPNYNATLINNSHLLVFPPYVGQQLQLEAQRILPEDPWVKTQIEKDPQFLANLQQRMAERTAPNISQLFEMTRHTIEQGFLDRPNADPSAMLRLLAMMIEQYEVQGQLLQKQRQENPPRRFRRR